MGTLIIALILVFIVWPVIKIAWRIYRMQSQAKRMFSQMNSQPRTEQPNQRKAGWSNPISGKRKKIGKDVGEYVSFESITVSTTETASSTEPTSERTDIRQEGQVSDAEWEEIR